MTKSPNTEVTIDVNIAGYRITHQVRPMSDVVATLVGDLIEQAAEDWVGLWEIPCELQYLLPDTDDAEVRRLGDQVVRALDTVEQLLSMWDALGRPPNQTEDVWFDLPDQRPSHE